MFCKLTLLSLLLSCTFGATEINLQMCIENFDIHKDKIIRTQDSRAMGAKYLNEIDLDSRVECLRLCCETDNCDVFVYEEKNSGSCYLFHCGPSEDFKCKFTHHVNYTSAVLAVNRHLPDLESQIKLTKHEQDLTKLRKPEISSQVMNIHRISDVKSVFHSTTTTATIPSTSAKDVLSIPKTNLNLPDTARKCSRYQFECRSTGDCIAIYNACDGIPQCADGSDEAPELGCPDSGTITTPPPSQPPPPGPVPGFAGGGGGAGQLPRNYEMLPNVQQQQQGNNPDVYNRPSFLMHNNVPKPDFVRASLTQQRQPPSSYDGASQLLQQQFPAQFAEQQQQQQVQNGWIPHQSNQMGPQLPNYLDKNSHIFNHKESGLQVSDGQESRYNSKYKGAMQTLHRALGYSKSGPSQYSEVPYPKIPNYYGEMYRQPLPQLQANWPVPGGQDENYNSVYNNNNNMPIVPAAASGNSQQHSQNFQESISVPSSSDWKPETGSPNLKRDEQDKMAHELKEHSKVHQQESKTREDQSLIKSAKIEKHGHTGHETMRLAVADKFKSEQDETVDGLAEAPGGAILSLTFGLIITCIMAILIGCRLRVVKRRLRRGVGKSYAHDADYLVNGMYL